MAQPDMKWFCTFLTRDFAANVLPCYCTIWFSSFFSQFWKCIFPENFTLITTFVLLHWGIFFNSSQKIVMKRLSIFVVVLVFWNWDTFDKSYFYGKLKTHFHTPQEHWSSNYCFVSPWIIWREESQFFQKAKRKALLIRTPQQSCPCLSILLNF